jgi:energy-coupling factor transport system substrate-specific component
MRTLLVNRATKFLLCGGSAAAINWLARFVLSAVMPFTPAVVLAQGVGMAVGFALYRTIVWRDAQVPWRRQLGMFVLVNTATGLLVLAVAVALVRLGAALGGPGTIVEAVAHAAAIAFGAVANFAGHQFLTFAAPRRSLVAGRA